MNPCTLVIGNKNYSSWSLRPWLLLKHFGVSFSEIIVSLYGEKTRADILRYSPSGRVPLLIDGDRKIWDSLAICEYVAEQVPTAKAWPNDAAARAEARSIASEMHSGFQALRNELPMNCRGRRTGVVPSPEAQADIARIVELWTSCRRRFGQDGPWLFGQFSIADAMFAPVAIRFSTYGVSLPDLAKEYVATVLSHPAMVEWMEAGRAESESFPQAERGIPA